MARVRSIGVAIVAVCLATGASAARGQLEASAPIRGSGVQVAGAGRSAIVDLGGTAHPGAQLWLRGSCGSVSCDGFTFADAAGRWHTRLALKAPPGRGSVRVRASYWPAAPVGGPYLTRVALGRSQAVQAQPEPGVSVGDPASGPAPQLVMIGDSLAVGTLAPLRDQLSGWLVRTDARVGRPLDEGMAVLRATGVAADLAGPRVVLAFSLFTNDAPTAVGRLDAAVRASVARLGPHDCAVWATIARPSVGSAGYGPANTRLRALAADPALSGRLLVVGWAEFVTHHRSLLAGDRVHATPAGYRARARLYARAARACAR